MFWAIELLWGNKLSFFCIWNKTYFLCEVYLKVFLCLIIVNRSFSFSMVIGVSSFSCFWLFLNDSMTLEKISSNYSIALFCFINSEFQNISYGFASTVAMKWFSFVKFVSPSTPRQVYNVLRWQIIEICFLMSERKFIVANSWCSLFSVVCSGTITLLYQVNVCFWMLFIYLSFWLCWSNICTSGVATENIYPSFIKWGRPWFLILPLIYSLSQFLSFS